MLNWLKRKTASGGVHFGQADPSLLRRDAMAAPVLQAATVLMQALIACPSAA